MSVFLQYTDSDYPFGIFKLFFYLNLTMGWTVKRWDKKCNQVYSLICQCLRLFTMVTIFQVNLNVNTLNHKWRNSYTIKCLWLIDIKSVRSISYYFCCIKSNGLYITKNSTFLASNQLTISIHCPAIVLSMFMLSFILVIVCDLFECKGICTSFFFILFVYICVVIGDPIITDEVWNPIHQFNPVTFMCLSQARTLISTDIICHGLFCAQWVDVRGDCLLCWYWWNCWPSLFKCFVDIGGIVDHHCLNVLLILVE